MPERLRRMRGHVLPRQLGQQPRPDAEERAGLVERPGRLGDQGAVAEHQDLLAREHRVQVLQLPAVHAQPRVVPEVRPARGHPAILRGAGGDKVRDRVQAGRPQMGPVGVRSLDRITQHDDESRVRDERPDPPLRGLAVEVERRGFAGQRAGWRSREQAFVVSPAPDVLAVGLRVAGPALGRRRPVSEEELRLLDRGQVQVRVPGQRGMQGGGARLGCTRHEEIRQRHGRRILHFVYRANRILV